MEYRLGNSNKIKSKGETLSICCPKCKTRGNFGIFSNFERRLAPTPLLLDLNTVYFAICPNCAGIFAVEEDAAKMFLDGNNEAISSDDLKSLKIFK